MQRSTGPQRVGVGVLREDGEGWIIRVTPYVSSARSSADTLRGDVRSICPRCQNLLWICEQHHDQPWPHDDCHGPGEPYPRCNGGDPPRVPPDFVSLIDGKL